MQPPPSLNRRSNISSHVRRIEDGVRYIFVLNHNEEPWQLEVPAQWVPLQQQDTEVLPPHTAMVFAQKMA